MNCAETVIETDWASEAQAIARNTVPDYQPLLSDEEVATIVALTLDWVRSHADEIPGYKRLGAYYRFRHDPIAQWLGGLEVLLQAEEVAVLLKVPKSWVYANADQIPGSLRLGRYLRFRPLVIKAFLGGSEVAQ
jgi:hypothetical protein